jgi:hypothetical protein
MRCETVVAVINLLAGGKRQEFSWGVEPGECAWLLTTHKGLLSIRVTWYRDDRWYRSPTDRGKTVFKGRCPLRDFATAVREQLQEIYTTLGPKGYKERWVAHEFPLADFKRL